MGEADSINPAEEIREDAGTQAAGVGIDEAQRGTQ